ncbi:MAG: hypothetical protein LAT67_00375 [Balneolales bacterium]|nr:hypothetical protein [Balneolales bacterium]
MNKVYTIIAAATVLLILLMMPEFATVALAQGPPGLPTDPPQVPIDGGLGILAAAGGAYALNKIRQRNKK